MLPSFNADYKISALTSTVISHSQERVIENLREQKEREDRVRFEELEQMRKENQELRDKLTALQPPKPLQSQVTNPITTQKSDGEVSIDWFWFNTDLVM